jgi:chromosome segregation ATPase
MGKRATNTAAAKAAAKKPKLDPALASVHDAVKSAVHLPERCRSMLLDLLPFSLAVESDVRSKSQTAVVGMMEETLMAVKAAMEAEVSSEKEKQQSIETTMVELERAVEEANAALNTQREATEAAKSALSDATKAMSDSQLALTEKQENQKVGDEKLTATRENKDALESAFKEHYQTPMEKLEAPNYNGLEPFLSQLNIEQSLLSSLPGTCAKDKASRGNFDEVVLTEFEKAMNSKIASLKETVETEIPASTEREEQVKLAEAEFNSKKEEHKQADDALAAARKELSEREIALEKAKGAVSDLQRQLASATGLHEAAQANVKFFETTPLTEFMALKSKTATPVEAAPAGA